MGIGDEDGLARGLHGCFEQTKAGVGGLRFLAVLFALAKESDPLPGVIDGMDEGINADDVFREVILRASLHGLNCDGGASGAGEHDDGETERAETAGELVQEAQAVHFG